MAKDDDNEGGAGRPVGPLEWWLDSSALPARFWACLYEEVGGKTVVLDLDGVRHAFADRNEAVAWLREDEYEPLTELQEAGELPTTLTPPGDFYPRD